MDVEYVIYETPHPPDTGQPCEDEPDTACPDTENPDMDMVRMVIVLRMLAGRAAGKGNFCTEVPFFTK